MQDKIKTIADKFNIHEMYVFGSRSKEIASFILHHVPINMHGESDVDIGVQPAIGIRLSAREKVLLTIELEDLLGVRQVDLVIIPESGPYLALDIIRGELLYCKNDAAQAENELFILGRAGDLAYFERERRNILLYQER